MHTNDTNKNSDGRIRISRVRSASERYSDAGFTFIETITVVAIALVLLGASVVSLAGLRTERALSAAADTVKAALEKTRLSALVKEDGAGYKLKLGETEVILFKSAAYSPSDPDNKVIGLPAGAKIFSIDLAGGGDVVAFNTLTGTTTAGTIVVAAINDPAKTRTIVLEGSGRVAVASASGSGGGSSSGGGGGGSGTADTGSQSFNLGWSIQTTSELKIRFLTQPANDNVFIMEPHFNGNRSVFDFVGYFGVGGVTQRVRIYSNHIDGNNTILNITRDPTNTGVASEISIDSRVIVTYLADGTVSVGAFGGTIVNQ